MRRFWTRRYAAWGACLLAGVAVQASAQDGEWASAPIPAGPSFASAFPAPQVPASQSPSAAADGQSAAVAQAFETAPVVSRPAPPLYLAAPQSGSSGNQFDARPIPVRRDAGTSLDALVGETPAPRSDEPSLLPGDLRAEDLQYSDDAPEGQVWARAVSQPAAGVPTPAGAAADPTAGLLETESAGMLQSTGPGPGDALSSSPQVYVQAPTLRNRLDGWYAEAGAIFLQRTGASSKVLSIDADTNLGTANAHDFNFAYASMPMLTIGYRAANGARWETTGYGITKWSDGISGVPDPASGFPTLRFPFLASGPNQFPISTFGTAQEVGYTSQLINLESNVYWRTGDVLGRRTNLMFGGRFIHVNEHLTMDNTSFLGLETYDVNTSNNILALQFGGEMFTDRMYDCLTLSAAAKGGIGINFLSQKSDLYTDDPFAGTPIFNSGEAEDACLSSIAEFSLRADIDLSRNATLRLGYHVIYLSGLALAPDQIDFTTAPGVSQRGLDENGNMVLQGPSVSLNYKF